MKQNSTRVLLALVTVLVILLVGCNRGEESTVRKITIAQFGDFFLYAPLYVAIDEGYFRDMGLEVSLISTGGDDKTWAAVLAGNAAFGVADPTFVAIAGTKGQPGTVIANIVDGVPFWGVTYNDEIPLITDATLLRGYSVATFPSPSTAFTLQSKMFRDASLEPKIREGAFGTLLTMAQTNQADIALELEPNVSQAAKGGARVLYSMRDLYGPFAVTGVTTTPKIVAGEPDLVRAVDCALQKALDLLHSQQSKALVHLKKRFPEISEDVAKAALERIVAGSIIPASLETTGKSWATATNLRIATGDLQVTTPVDSYIDNSFARETLSRSECRLN